MRHVSINQCIHTSIKTYIQFSHQAPHVDCVIDGYAIPAGKQTTTYLYIIIAFALFVFLSLSLSPAGAVKVTSSAGTKWILPEQVPDVLRKHSWLHEIELFCPTATW